MMGMDSRIEETIRRHDKGYNCAQSVACTYCDLVGVDESTMFKMTEALGLGMGGMSGTCGAVSGACVLAGMKRSSGNLEHPDSKAASYQLSKEIVRQFEEQNHSSICRTLKGVDTGTVLRSCPDCIRDAAAIADKILFDKE
jgi:C_GCAxxG_C_C family probable redox protein